MVIYSFYILSQTLYYLRLFEAVVLQYIYAGKASKALEVFLQKFIPQSAQFSDRVKHVVQISLNIMCTLGLIFVEMPLAAAFRNSRLAACIILPEICSRGFSLRPLFDAAFTVAQAAVGSGSRLVEQGSPKYKIFSNQLLSATFSYIRHIRSLFE